MGWSGLSSKSCFRALGKCELPFGWRQSFTVHQASRRRQGTEISCHPFFWTPEFRWATLWHGGETKIKVDP